MLVGTKGDELETVEIEPIGAAVLLRCVPQKKSDGKHGAPVHLAPNARTDTRAIVLATGPGYRLEVGGYSPCQAKRGDRVIVPSEAPVVLIERDEERGNLVIVHEESLCAVDKRPIEKVGSGAERRIVPARTMPRGARGAKPRARLQ